jgi:hypothetical protein
LTFSAFTSLATITLVVVLGAAVRVSGLAGAATGFLGRALGVTRLAVTGADGLVGLATTLLKALVETVGDFLSAVMMCSFASE